MITGASSRLIGLDLLRLLAIVLVLGVHVETPPGGWDETAQPFFHTWFSCGGRGVELFFVLSGFLVSGLLFSEYRKHNTISVARFYVRRAWRIYPAFYFLAIFSYLFSWLALDWRPLDSQIFSELFFLQSYKQGYWNHTWTLAVEEHFYILLPLLLLVCTRLSSRTSNPFWLVPYLALASLAIFLAVRIVNYMVRSEYSFHTHWWATHLCLDGMFLGVGIAYAYHFHHEGFRRFAQPLRYPLVALGLATLLSAAWLRIPLTQFYIHTFARTQFYLGAAALLVGVLMCQIPQNRLTRGFAWVGSRSYSIYLWHMALIYWAMPGLRGVVSWELRTLMYIVGAFVIGIGMSELIEAPLLRLRDRWHPSRSMGQNLSVQPPIRLAA